MPLVASISAPNGICWPAGRTTPFTSTVPEIGTTLKFTSAMGSGSVGVGPCTGGAVGGKPGGTGVGSGVGVGTVQSRWRTTFVTGFAAVTVSGLLVTVPQLVLVARTRYVPGATSQPHAPRA